MKDKNSLSHANGKHEVSSHRLTRCECGSAATEFALAAPILLVMLGGIFDVGQMALGRAVLQGVVNEAARSSTLESADPTVTDNLSQDLMAVVLPGAELTAKRRSYYDFDDIERAEAWNDADNSGVCDNLETFTDENGNGQWDSDIGLPGNGSAGDVVVFEVKAKYTPLLAFIPFGENKERTLTATTTVKKNQPYALQETYGSDTGVCD